MQIKNTQVNMVKRKFEIYLQTPYHSKKQIKHNIDLDGIILYQKRWIKIC